MKISKRKAQTLGEYAVILGIAAAAFVAMQVYIQRGVQGKIRVLADQISPTQYESNTTTSAMEITRSSSTNIDSYGYRTITTINNDTTQRTGNEETVAETIK